MFLSLIVQLQLTMIIQRQPKFVGDFVPLCKNARKCIIRTLTCLLLFNSSKTNILKEQYHHVIVFLRVSQHPLELPLHTFYLLLKRTFISSIAEPSECCLYFTVLPSCKEISKLITNNFSLFFCFVLNGANPAGLSI